MDELVPDVFARVEERVRYLATTRRKITEPTAINITEQYSLRTAKRVSCPPGIPFAGQQGTGPNTPAADQR
jgi:hypothetical protein